MFPVSGGGGRGERRVDKVCKRYRHPSPLPPTAAVGRVILENIFTSRVYLDSPMGIRQQKLEENYAILFVSHRALPERSRGVRPLRRELFAV